MTKPDVDIMWDAVKEAGGAIAVAKALGLHRQAIYKWKETGRVPGEHVRVLSEMSGVPREDLRPDIFG